MRISPKNGTLPLPKLPTISGMLRPNSVLPSLVNKANPPKRVRVPNVATKADNLAQATSRPLSIPPARPAKIETPIAKEYYLDKLISDEKGEIAVILNTKSEDEAINMKNELISKGFKANYFFTSEYSNISEESYEILIGPYETENELKQWLNNISTESITRISL